MRYNLSKLMRKAWSLFRSAARKTAITFSEALRKAWAWIRVQEDNTAKVEAAAEAAGIVEEVPHLVRMAGPGAHGDAHQRGGFQGRSHRPHDQEGEPRQELLSVQPDATRTDAVKDR